MPVGIKDAILDFVMETTTPQTPVQQVQTAVTNATQTVLKQLPLKDRKLPMYIGIALLVVLLGVGSGWFLSNRTSGASGSPTKSAPGAKTSATEAGIGDEKTFKDTATGDLQEGGINGEGTHHLVRPGGDTQNVYLTSTVIDLGSFVGKKVQVWGQTISAQQAGWLMDVGKIKAI